MVPTGFWLIIRIVSMVRASSPLERKKGPDRDGVSDIYDHSRNFKKAKAYLVAPGPKSIFSSIERESHRIRRKVIARGLSDTAMKAFEPAMLAHIRLFCERLLEGSDMSQSNSSMHVRNMTDLCKC